jgi:hypothetical protein
MTTMGRGHRARARGDGRSHVWRSSHEYLNDIFLDLIDTTRRSRRGHYPLDYDTKLNTKHDLARGCSKLHDNQIWLTISRYVTEGQGAA